MKKLVALIVMGLFISISTVSVYAHETGEPHEEIEATDEAHLQAEQSDDPQTVNSFDLFWPISAGRVMGDPLYFLKSVKEQIREVLVFSSFKKADYNITLSEKRTVEAEKLFVDSKDLENATRTLQAASDKRQRALDLIIKAEGEGRYVVDLKTTLKNSLEKQRVLLQYVATQVSDDAKSAIDNNVSNLNEILAKLEG